MGAIILAYAKAPYGPRYNGTCFDCFPTLSPLDTLPVEHHGMVYVIEQSPNLGSNTVVTIMITFGISLVFSGILYIHVVTISRPTNQFIIGLTAAQNQPLKDTNQTWPVH